MIEIEGLVKSYDGLRVLDSLDFQVREGEMVAVLGRTGCGKTTLLKILAGIEDFQAGKVDVKGTTSMMFQEPRLADWRTVSENVSLAVELRGGEIGEREIEKILEKVDLEGYLERYPRQLSGGESQRVALARTLAVRPDIFLMDEPSSSIDASTTEKILDLIKDIHREKEKTTVFVTHDIQDAVKMGDRVVVLSEKPTDKKTVFDGEIDVEDLRKSI